MSVWKYHHSFLPGTDDGYGQTLKDKGHAHFKLERDRAIKPQPHRYGVLLIEDTGHMQHSCFFGDSCGFGVTVAEPQMLVSNARLHRVAEALGLEA